MSRPGLYVMVFFILINTCSTYEIVRDIKNNIIIEKTSVSSPEVEMNITDALFEIEKLKTENKRLRAALSEIAEWKYLFDNETAIDGARTIAYEVLQPMKGVINELH